MSFFSPFSALIMSSFFLFSSFSAFFLRMINVSRDLDIQEAFWSDCVRIWWTFFFFLLDDEGHNLIHTYILYGVLLLVFFLLTIRRNDDGSPIVYATASRIPHAAFPASEVSRIGKFLFSPLRPLLSPEPEQDGGDRGACHVPTCIVYFTRALCLGLSGRN
ncbi:hypothetical protein VTO42DRAFT_8699 [Malbranchea cinnamomea]